MTEMMRYFTSESVTEGHPDKVCDQISDAILDALLEKDKNSRVAVETLVTTGLVHVAGEVDSNAYVEIPQIVRQVVRDIGYTSSAVGFDGDSCGVTISIGQQSRDIAAGVNQSLENREHGDNADKYSQQGAGDQGIMFGYATDETPAFMPLPIFAAHRLAERLAQVRKENIVENLRPDGKTQVTVRYEGDRPVAINNVVVSTQHGPDMDQKQLHADIAEFVVTPVLESLEIEQSDFQLLVNPTGRFEIGGPMGDAGLTGRKIIVDTYGGSARHGGGAFSGKDPSKVDRSAAYATRWVAKNVVAAGLAKRCEIQVAYAIGKAEPVGLYIDTFGTETATTDRIEAAIRKVFDLRPAAIVEQLELLRPIYAKTAAYGHFGRELPQFNWERTDRIQDLLSAL